MENPKPVAEMTTDDLILYISTSRPAMDKNYVTLLEGKLADPRSVEIVLEVLARQIRGMQSAYEEFKELQETEPGVFCSAMAGIMRDYEVLREVEKRAHALDEVHVMSASGAPGIT